MERRMTEKQKPKRDDPEQSERFIKSAREVGADETEKGADKAFKKVVPPKEKRSQQRR
jgi:hypothetical protein